MSADIDTNINIRYTIENIDGSIQKSKRLLYFLNAVRLSVKDIQQVMSGPTIANVLWTSIQLTRTWTQLVRLIRMAKREQQALLVQTTLTGGIRGTGILASIAARGGITGATAAFVTANPVVAGIVVGAVIVGGVAVSERNRRIQDRINYIENQREIAKTQGWQN